jgi:hypothetical protein
MRNVLRVVGITVISAVGFACAYNPPPVPVEASRADWEILGGEWRGSYSTTPQGRSGSIEFKLSAGEEQAAGDVLMVAENAKTPYRPFPPGDSRLGPTNTPYSQLLAIRFVRAEQGKISGTIASYWDPDRSCQATATFLGEVKDRTIDGTFTSLCEDGVRRLQGRWRVTKQPTSAR